EQNLRGFEVNPRYPPITASGSVAREIKGDLRGAIEGFRKACEMTGDRPPILAYLGHALARAGEVEEARAIATRLGALPGTELDVATVKSGLRDEAGTLDSLEAAVGRRAIHLLNVPADARFDWLRGTDRFQRMMRQMGLEAQTRRAE